MRCLWLSIVKAACRTSLESSFTPSFLLYSADTHHRGHDCYHTCYALSGLSAAQNKPTYSTKRALELLKVKSPQTAFQGSNESLEAAEERERKQWASLNAWVEPPNARIVVGLDTNRVVSTTQLIPNDAGADFEACSRRRIRS